MKVAFCGTSGAGKTTLVKYVNQEYNLPWISGSSGDLKTEEDKAKLPDINGKGHENVIVRSATNPMEGWLNQRQILRRRAELIKNSIDLVTDRSPVDNLVYCIQQCGYHKEIDNHMLECFAMEAINAFRHLTHLIYIKPCQPLGKIEENGSRVTNWYYQLSLDTAFDYWINHLFKVHCPSVGILTLDIWDLETRKYRIDNFLRG